jgi:hypothetical protein
MASDEITEAESEEESESETLLPCPLLSCIGELLDQQCDIDELGYIPVKCNYCGFTGRRLNSIVVSD